ncbi:MAG: hypothetical protein AB7K71_39190 [Polyangiaceae bacterium]
MAGHQVHRGQRFAPLWLLAGIGFAVAACGDDVEVGSMGDGGAGTSNGGVGGSAANGGTAGNGGSAGSLIGNGGAGGSASGGTAHGGSSNGGTTNGGAGGSDACVPTKCQNHLYQCGNCLDDDNDGLIDSEDPDCLGPCDNTEDSFASGIPGGNQAPCKMDCYFDQDSGSNDGCYWSHSCDPLSKAPEYYPSANSACAYDANANIPGTGKGCDELLQSQDAQCEASCGPLTPNGCDCFGCCELPVGSGKFVYLGSEVNKQPTCSRDAVSDSSKCHPCTPVPSCFNDCGICELCVGKDSVPQSCNPQGSGGAGGSGSGGSAGQGGGGGSSQCPTGVQPCNAPGQSPCVAGYYCVTGCCVEAPR